MKYMSVVLGLVMAFTLGLFSIVHSRRNLDLQLTKTLYFENVKHKVTVDMLKELQSNNAEANTRLEQTKKKVTELQTNVKTAQEVANGKNTELTTCNNALAQITADIGALDAEKSKTQTEFQQNKASLVEQIKNLKEEYGKRSKVCDYIIKTSVEGMKLCGIVQVIQVEQKAEAPKAA